jgi:RimJ/RimL family protein N-acetyltransferase
MTDCLETERLILRQWREQDRLPFRAMNTNPRVMEFLPGPLDSDASDALADRIQKHFELHGFGLFAAELRADQSFIGYIGLAVPRFEAHFTPAVEIGWRIAAQHWGSGLATEGACSVLRFGFESIGLDSIVSFTVPENTRSLRVMQKLGMTHDPADDFDHPRFSEGHALRRHVLYRIDHTQWDQQQSR